MALYKLASSAGAIIRTSDNASIPFDPGNRDYVDLLAWQAAGGVPDPYVPPPAPPPTVMSQDMMAQFTVADYSKIKTAVASNDAFGLLWASLQAQRDPMTTTNARFVAGWSALVTVLGLSRMNQIAAALGAHTLVA